MTDDGKIEWRLCCAGFGVDRTHRTHTWHVGPRNTKDGATRDAFLADRNSDPVMRTASYAGCLPLRLESRYLSPWTPYEDDPFEAVEWWAEAFGSRSDELDGEPIDQGSLW